MKKFTTGLLISIALLSAQQVYSYSYDDILVNVHHNPNLIKQAILAGGDPNARNTYGVTALQMAVSHDDFEKVKLLVGTGHADVNLTGGSD